MTRPREDGCGGCSGLSDLYIGIILLKTMKPLQRVAVELLVQLELQERGQEAKRGH